MEIKIKRTKELKKGGLLSGKNVRLFLEMSVSLSEDEKALIEKYHDPYVSILTDIPGYFKTKEAFDIVKDIRGETDLSKFHVTVHVDDGFKFLGNIETLEKAMVTELSDKLSYLKALDRWEGEEVITA